MKKQLFFEFNKSLFRKMSFRMAAFAVLMLLSVQTSFAQQWNIIGNETAVSSVVSTYTSVAVVTESGNDIPYVAFCDNGVPKVKKRLANGTWTQVGDNLGTNATYTRINADANGNLYVAYIDGSAGSKLIVKKYNTGTQLWNTVGGTGVYVSPGSATNAISQFSSTFRSSMAFDSANNPYIAYIDATSNLAPVVKKFDGTNWVTQGSTIINPTTTLAALAHSVSLVIDGSDVPWLAFSSVSTTSSTGGTVALYQLVGGTTWTAAATSTATSARHTSLAITSAGNFAIVYFDATASTGLNRATAFEYDKTANTWGTVSRLGARDSTNITLIRDTSGNLYCSFIDAVTTGFLASTRGFKQAAGTTTWTELKDPTVVRGVDESTSNLSIGVANGSTVPFIAYTKANSNSLSTPIVRKYNPIAPAITGITPVTTPVTGQAFTITGTNFTGATAVSFGGSNITSFTVDSATQISGTIDSGTSLSASVTTPEGTANFTANTLSYILSKSYFPTTANSVIAIPTFTTGGTFTVSPALPTNVSISSSSGIISIGSSAASATASNTYTVTLTTPYGTVTAPVTFEIGSSAAPSALNYTVPSNFVTNTAITPLNPTITNGTGSVYSVSPSLPADLVLDANTGIISGTPTVITANTSYAVRATTAFGFTTKVVTFTTATSTIWNGATWSHGTPTSTLEAIIDGTYSTTTNGAITAKKLTVNSGKLLTINTGTTVTVQSEVINNGSLVVENNANLIQVLGTTNTNTGNIVVNRNSNALSRLDYTLWSSPVAGQNLAAFSPLTSQSQSRFYTYDTANNQYSNAFDPTATNFAAATGYLIRMPNTAVAFPATETFAGQFTGVPNNGDVPFALSTAGGAYNLVGNPYPSTINLFTLQSNNSTVIGTTFYMWRTTNAAGTAYCTYVPTSTTAGTYVSNGNAQSPVSFVGNIQPGQAFFVKALTTGPLVFKNAQRVTTSGSFFKTKQVAAADKVWLNATNAAGGFSQMAVTYFDGATPGVDAFDGKYINDSPLALTSNINNEEYTIQGRPAFDASDVVPLNFKTDMAGNYTIAIDHSEGVFAAGQSVILADATTGTETDLTTSSYTFTATTGTANSRFSLKYQKTLGTNQAVFSDNKVTVYRSKGTLYVNAGDTTIANIKVYDVQGKLVAELKNGKATSATIANLKATNQVLVVKITSQEDKVVTKKVVN